MKELVCPNCGKAFTVDEADYASIVNQVKNTEFQEEVRRRVAELQSQQDAIQKAKDVTKDSEIARLREKITAIDAKVQQKKQTTNTESHFSSFSHKNGGIHCQGAP